MPLPSLQPEAPPEIRLTNRSVMRSEWRDPTDLMPSAARSAKIITGWRNYDPLRRCLQRHGDRCSITKHHIAAADLLRGAADGARIGFSPGPRLDGLPVSAVVYGPTPGPGRTAMRQLHCSKQFNRAWTILAPQQRALVAACVLRNHSVDRVCRERREAGQPGDSNQLMRELIVCLNLLEAHFRTELDRAASIAA
jgi:hypothetical protein